jgi:hypothetical protein
MRTKHTPPKWTDKEEYEDAYRWVQRQLRLITVLGALLCTLTHVINTFVFWPVPHPYYWLFWGIGSGGLLVAITALCASLKLKHDHPDVLAWYEENQGDDAVTINE